jgi:hypothetical protein
MAQRLAQRRQANAQLPMAAPQMAAAPITSALRHDGPRIERTSPFVHTLVTKPKMETQLAVLPRDTTPKVVHTPQPAIPAELTHGFSMAPLVPQAPVTGAEIGVADGAPTPLLPLDMMAAATPPSRTPPLPAPPTDTLAPVAPQIEALAPLADTTPPTAESRTAESPAAALAADPLPAQAAADPAASDAEIEAAMAAVISENPAPSNDLAPIVTNNTEPSGELALHEWPDPDGSTVVGAPATAMRRVPTIPPAAAPDAANTPRAEKAPRVVRDAIPAPAAADSHSASNNWPSDAHPGDEREAAIAAAASGIVVEISNGAGRDRMATRFRSYLQARGFANLRVSNDKSFRNHATVVYYREGYREAADLVARELPFSATLERADDLTVHVRVLLGGDFLEWDRRQLITGLALQSPGQDVANLN